MKPDAAAPADLILRLRQQLVLAQVRIMELEDARDELAPRAAELEKLLTAAQVLTDRKVEEAAHLEKVRTGLQAQYDHMRHMQHVTNEALNAERTKSAGLERELQDARQTHATLRQKIATGQAQVDDLTTGLTQARNESAAQLARIGQLETERRAVQASRSWRWTAWLRSLERMFGGRKP